MHVRHHIYGRKKNYLVWFFSFAKVLLLMLLQMQTTHIRKCASEPIYTQNIPLYTINDFARAQKEMKSGLWYRVTMDAVECLLDLEQGMDIQIVLDRTGYIIFESMGFFNAIHWIREFAFFFLGNASKKFDVRIGLMVYSNTVNPNFDFTDSLEEFLL